MSGVINSLFGLTVPHGEIQKCITELENALGSMNETAYHQVIGKSFLHQAKDLSEIIIQFHNESINNGPVKAIYFEMNGFTINPDCWYFNLFGYDKSGDMWELDWLSDWNYESENIILTGMEMVQGAFESIYLNTDARLIEQIAGEITEHLVVSRFCETVTSAVNIAKSIDVKLKDIQFLATAHDWETVCSS